jgi:hypothetical protein
MSSFEDLHLKFCTRARAHTHTHVVPVNWTASRQALGPNQPPSQCEPGTKRPVREANHSPPFNVDVKNEWRCTSTPPTGLHSVVLCFLTDFNRQVRCTAVGEACTVNILNQICRCISTSSDEIWTDILYFVNTPATRCSVFIWLCLSMLYKLYELKWHRKAVRCLHHIHCNCRLTYATSPPSGVSLRLLRI